ncbi:MAG: tetratricopeptide repeat protein [bacterium]|nr:tetratricopeptide repeat protein [bacterium]
MRHLRLSIMGIIGLVCGILAGAPAFAQDAAPAPQGQQPMTGSPYALRPAFERAAQAFSGGDFERAILDASLYILINPTDNRGYFVRGLSYLQINELTSGQSDLSQSIALTGDDEPEFLAQAYGLRASVRSAQGDTDGALADLEQSLRVGPSADAYFARALIYREQGEDALALADMDQAVALSPDDAVYHLYRAVIHDALGNVVENAADILRYIALSETRRIDGDALQPGRPIEIDLATGTVYALPFSAQAGQRLTALVVGRPGEQSDPVFVVLDPSGAPLIGDDDGTGGLDAVIVDHPLPETGTYTLLVTSTPTQAAGQGLVGIELLTP